MDSCSGGSSSACSVPGSIQKSGSEDDLQQMMDQRKRKRMISNRESARRSRMRKQKHMDDLAAEIAQLRKHNTKIINNISVTTHHFLDFEAENSILRAQAGELSHMLVSLNEIIDFIYVSNVSIGGFPASNYLGHPIMACVEMFQYG